MVYATQNANLYMHRRHVVFRTHQAFGHPFYRKGLATSTMHTVEYLKMIIMWKSKRTREKMQRTKLRKSDLNQTVLSTKAILLQTHQSPSIGPFYCEIRVLLIEELWLSQQQRLITTGLKLPPSTVYNKAHPKIWHMFTNSFADFCNNFAAPFSVKTNLRERSCAQNLATARYEKFIRKHDLHPEVAHLGFPEPVVIISLRGAVEFKDPFVSSEVKARPKKKMFSTRHGQVLSATSPNNMQRKTKSTIFPEIEPQKKT
eukprot:284815182_2